MEIFKPSTNEGAAQNPLICGCESIKGNAIELSLEKKDCEVRADVIINKSKGVRIWGQVRDCNGLPIENALIKLVKITRSCGRVGVKGIAHTTTDCSGFYQFDVDTCEIGSKYKVLVHKSASGKERLIPKSKLLCDPFSEDLTC